MAFSAVNFLFSLLVAVTMAQIIYKKNMNVSSILEARSASNEIHTALRMQASECVPLQSYGFDI